MDRALIEQTVRAVLSRMSETRDDASASPPIVVEASARHVHLSERDCTALFGQAQPTEVRAISQPGQYLSKERVRLVGPRGVLDNVAVLGPARSATQVEISMTDARALGVDAPVRLSGDLAGAAHVFIQAGEAMIEAQAAIVAERHLHLPAAEARALGLGDREIVRVRVHGARPLVLEGVVVRATDPAAARLHIDTDEANAAGVGRDTLCTIERGAGAAIAPAVPVQMPEKAVPAVQAASIEGKLIAEHDALALVREGAKKLVLRPGQLVTPLARDALRAGGVELTDKENKA
ncbi:MAG: phosphate propanoyltransferase [Christensenellaceae bacterium]|nr:phosphate propanoyltransferase [Christensenellaceae bacterium]MEA5068665.1 phosphate propanoyltransferase [Christensenellaceae bacterium]